MNICRDEGRKWVSNKDGSRVGRGAKIEEKICWWAAVGGGAGRGGVGGDTTTSRA